MGLGFTPTKFDQTPDNPFYLCKCGTHIVLKRDYQYTSFTEEPELSGCIFQNVAANVHTLSPEQDRMAGNDHKVSDVYCNNCGEQLGVKIMEYPSNGEMREGDFLLRLPKLKMWNGHQIVDAEYP